MNKKSRVLFLSVLSIAAIFCIIPILPFRVPPILKTPFSTQITRFDTLPDSSTDAIYILGGSWQSSKHHFKRAAGLFKEKKTTKILIMNSTMRWDFDPEINRNLTRNEAECRYLNSCGVPMENIEKIPIHEGFFGTLSEARDVAEYCAAKGYKSVILVTSPGHTRRVALCFGYYLQKKSISMYIVHSKDPFLFSEMIAEFFKLQVYRVIIGCR